MADRFVMSHIRRLPLFATLPDEGVALLSDAFRVTRYEPGEILFRQGQPAQGMYMLITGRGALLQQTPAGMRTIGMIETNQYINEAALVRELIETATFQVVEPSIVLFLSRQLFQRFIASHPQFHSSLRVPNLTPLPPATVQSKPAAVMPVVNTPAAKPPPAQTMRNMPEFAGQRSDERLMLLTRRHWWAYLRKIWFPLIVAAVLFSASVAMPSPEMRLATLGIMVVIPGLVMAYFYFDWHNDLLIITDQRILRKEHTLLTFNRHLSDIPIRSVQAVNSEIPTYDIFARLFVYGDLVVKTAGQAGTIKLDFIPNPEHVQDIIFQRINDKSHEVKQKQDAIRAEVNRVLAGNAPSSTPPPPQPNPTAPGLLQTRYTNAQGDTIYRKHLIFWFSGVFLPLLLIGGSVLLFFLWLIIPTLNAFGIVVLPLCGVLLLAGGLWFYWSDWDWRNDLYIIGNDTITLIHRRPLWLQNEDDRILVSRIDNVTVEMIGLFQSLFNYGNVKIALVGDSGTKIFRGVPDPRGVQEEISKRQARTRQAIIDAEESRRRQEIASYLAAYDEVQKAGAQPQQYAPQNYTPPYAPQAASPNPPTAPAAPRPQYGSGIPGSRPDPNVSPNPDLGTPPPGNRPPNVPQRRP